MKAIRLHEPGGIEGLALDEIDEPLPAAGEALVRVHAAAITRDELGWPTDRLPAIPSYELSGVVAAVASDVAGPAVGDEVYALTPFDRDGVAAELVALPAALLAPKPRNLGHVESAAIPLPALSAWQGLFDHGGLEAGRRVLVTGASGGVGRYAVQLARHRGAYVIGVASAGSLGRVDADERVDREAVDFDALDVDIVFDTAGGELLARARARGRIVSIAEEPPAGGVYFVVEPNRAQPS